MTQLEKRILRKCWMHIRNIQNAHNILQIESALSNIQIDTFSLRDKGMHYIIAKENDNTADFFLTFSHRELMQSFYKQDIMNFALSFANPRFKKCSMWSNIKAYNVVRSNKIPCLVALY